jgi:putative inorganic carbon (hco3(-)) transporter
LLLRDLTVFLLLATIVVMTFRRPLFGVLGWVLFALLNPHRLTWGPAYDFAFSQVIALTTLAAVLLTKDHRQIKGGAPAFLLVLILLCSIINAPLGFDPTRAWGYVDRVFKGFLFVWLALLLMHTRQHVMWLVGTFIASLAFYGVKGGLFTLATGGNFRVNGPSGSMVAGNNELAVALIVTIPMLYFAYQQLKRPLYRQAVFATLCLCAVAAIGSHSRGALLAIAGMSVVLWMRSQHKLMLGAGLAALVFIAIPFMPDHWTERMNTIKTYEEDASASYRLIAWETAYNLAKDRFPLGGGLEYETREVSARYSPDPNLVMVPHSVYFQTMGGLGFIGLGLWLAFWILVWRQCAWLRKHCRSPGTLWAGQLGSMVQVSLAGYAIGGAFLNLAFWDGMYYLYAAIGVTVYVARRQLAAEAGGSHSAAAGTSARVPSQGVAAPLAR